MQVYKAFFKIAKKNLAGTMMYAAIFFSIGIIMTIFGNRSVESNFEAAELSIYIEDEDQTPASEALIEYLGNIHNVSTEPMTEEEIKDQLYYRQLSYVLVIQKGFGEGLEGDGKADLLESIKLPGSANGTFVDNQIQTFVGTVKSYLRGGFTLSEAVEKVQDEADATKEVEVISFKEEKVGESIFYFYQYIPYVLLAFLLSGLTPILVTLGKEDFDSRVNCASVSLLAKTTQTAAGCIVYSFGSFLLFMLMGVILYRSDMFQTETLLCMLNAFVYLLFSLGVALFISGFAPSLAAMSMISNVISLGMSFLCGVFVPQFMLAKSVISISKFLPAYWYIRANTMLAGMYNASLEMSAYWNCILVQLLFAAAMFAAYLVLMKMKRQSK